MFESDPDYTGDASYSVYLTFDPSTEGSQLIIGGVDMSLAQSEFNYIDLVSESYWVVQMDEV